MINWLTVGYVGFLIETAAAFLMSVLVVRELSIEDLGAYKLAGSIILVGSYLTSCGLDSTFQRFGAEMLALKRHEQLSRLMRLVRVVRVIALVAFCGILLGFQGPIAATFNFPDSLTVLLVVVCGVLVVQSNVMLNGFTFFAVRGARVEASLLRVLSACLRLAAIGVAVVASTGLPGMLGGTFLAGAAVLAYVAWRNRQWRATLPAEGAVGAGGIAYRKRIVKYSLVNYLAVNVTVLRDLSVDLFVIAYFLGPEQVAIYGMATTLVMFANSLNPASLLRGLLTPLIVADHAVTTDNSHLPRTFLVLTKAVVILYFPLIVGLMVLGEAIIRLVYSAELRAAYEPLLVLCGLGLFQALTYPFSPLIAALEKNTVHLLTVITAAFSLSLSITLVPRIGIIGAAWASGLAGVLQLALYWVAFRFGVKRRLTFPFRTLAVTAVNLVPAVAIAVLALPYLTSFFRLLLVTLACAGTYIATLYWNHGFSPEELRMVQQVVRRRGV